MPDGRALGGLIILIALGVLAWLAIGLVLWLVDRVLR